LVREPHDHVEVDRLARRGREVAEQRAVDVVVTVGERPGDDLDRAVIELREHFAQRDHLVV
jgi:hypothetical protein